VSYALLHNRAVEYSEFLSHHWICDGEKVSHHPT